MVSKLRVEVLCRSAERVLYVSEFQTDAEGFIWQRKRRMLSEFNPLTPTLKLHSNGTLYRNTVIGTLAVDGWAVTFRTARRVLGGIPSPPTAPPRCTKCTAVGVQILTKFGSRMQTFCLSVVTLIKSFCRAMLCKRGLCRHAVSLCVCPSRSWILSKRINISSTFVHRRVG